MAEKDDMEGGVLGKVWGGIMVGSEDEDGLWVLFDF